MINERISIDLLQPWVNHKFETDHIGVINFLVGPNGSGKSQFARALFGHLTDRAGGCRILGTDRLSEMAAPGPVQTNMIGDHFSGGYAKSEFSTLRQAGTHGSGIDTVVLLEERMDIRIQVEATLSHLFNRDITMEWDSGNIIPMVERRGGGGAYRLDRDECHGIKELLVLLTHLYDEENRYLIVDEPELNLHPQYQAFFMQEVRQVAGDKKVVFLITHSPFILDLRSEDDLKSIITFDLEYSVPKQVAGLSLDVSTSVIPTRRWNAHHKQIFFADNPVFVEGTHDAAIVEALMEALGTSVAGAGSCIIDAGGVEEVNHFLKLCKGLGKEAHFVYDLDSLFKGKLRQCIGDDESIQSLLATAGVGSNFGAYVGQLDQCLTKLIDQLLSVSLPCSLDALGKFMHDLGNNRSEWSKEKLAKARVAVMTAISCYREEVASATSESDVQDIEGRRDRILTVLEELNIHVLSGGTLERYLPQFQGDVFSPTPEAKSQAVEAELQDIQRLSPVLGKEKVLAERYGELYSVVCRLPSKTEVDVDAVLRRHLSDYIHELQKTAKDNPGWQHEQIQQVLNKLQISKNGTVSLKEFERTGEHGFKAIIGVGPILGKGPRILSVNENTTYTNMREFELNQALEV